MAKKNKARSMVEDLAKGTSSGRKVYTLSLDTVNFEKLKAIASKKGIKYSSLVDKLVDEFLREYKE